MASVGCQQKSRDAIDQSLATFGVETHRHAEEMLNQLQRHGGIARKRAQSLAHQVSSIAREDRTRLRSAGGKSWSDVDLEAL